MPRKRRQQVLVSAQVLSVSICLLLSFSFAEGSTAAVTATKASKLAPPSFLSTPFALHTARIANINKTLSELHTTKRTLSGRRLEHRTLMIRNLALRLRDATGVELKDEYLLPTGEGLIVPYVAGNEVGVYLVASPRATLENFKIFRLGAGEELTREMIIQRTGWGREFLGIARHVDRATQPAQPALRYAVKPVTETIPQLGYEAAVQENAPDGTQKPAYLVRVRAIGRASVPRGLDQKSHVTYYELSMHDLRYEPTSPAPRSIFLSCSTRFGLGMAAKALSLLEKGWLPNRIAEEIERVDFPLRDLQHDKEEFDSQPADEPMGLFQYQNIPTENSSLHRKVRTHMVRSVGRLSPTLNRNWQRDTVELLDLRGNPVVSGKIHIQTYRAREKETLTRVDQQGVLFHLSESPGRIMVRNPQGDVVYDSRVDEKVIQSQIQGILQERETADLVEDVRYHARHGRWQQVMSCYARKDPLFVSRLASFTDSKQEGAQRVLEATKQLGKFRSEIFRLLGILHGKNAAVHDHLVEVYQQGDALGRVGLTAVRVFLVHHGYLVETFEPLSEEEGVIRGLRQLVGEDPYAFDPQKVPEVIATLPSQEELTRQLIPAALACGVANLRGLLRDLHHKNRAVRNTAVQTVGSLEKLSLGDKEKLVGVLTQNMEDGVLRRVPVQRVVASFRQAVLVLGRGTIEPLLDYLMSNKGNTFVKSQVLQAIRGLSRLPGVDEERVVALLLHEVFEPHHAFYAPPKRELIGTILGINFAVGIAPLLEIILRENATADLQAVRDQMMLANPELIELEELEGLFGQIDGTLRITPMREETLFLLADILSEIGRLAQPLLPEPKLADALGRIREKAWTGAEEIYTGIFERSTDFATRSRALDHLQTLFEREGSKEKVDWIAETKKFIERVEEREREKDRFAPIEARIEAAQKMNEISGRRLEEILGPRHFLKKDLGATPWETPLQVQEAYLLEGVTDAAISTTRAILIKTSVERDGRIVPFHDFLILFVEIGAMERIEHSLIKGIYVRDSADPRLFIEWPEEHVNKVKMAVNRLDVGELKKRIPPPDIFPPSILYGPYCQAEQRVLLFPEMKANLLTRFDLEMRHLAGLGLGRGVVILKPREEGQAPPALYAENLRQVVRRWDQPADIETLIRAATLHNYHCVLTHKQRADIGEYLVRKGGHPFVRSSHQIPLRGNPEAQATEFLAALRIAVAHFGRWIDPETRLHREDISLAVNIGQLPLWMHPKSLALSRDKRLVTEEYYRAVENHLLALAREEGPLSDKYETLIYCARKCMEQLEFRHASRILENILQNDPEPVIRMRVLLEQICLSGFLAFQGRQFIIVFHIMGKIKNLVSAHPAEVLNLLSTPVRKGINLGLWSGWLKICVSQMFRENFFQQLRDLVDQQPPSNDARVALANVHLLAQEVDKAEQIFSSIHANPDDPAYWECIVGLANVDQVRLAIETHPPTPPGPPGPRRFPPGGPTFRKPGVSLAEWMFGGDLFGGKRIPGMSRPHPRGGARHWPLADSMLPNPAQDALGASL